MPADALNGIAHSVENQKNQDTCDIPGVLIVTVSAWALKAARTEAEVAAIRLVGRSFGCLRISSPTGWLPVESGKSEQRVRKELPGDWLLSKLVERERSRIPLHPSLAEISHLQHKLLGQTDRSVIHLSDLWVATA